MTIGISPTFLLSKYKKKKNTCTLFFIYHLQSCRVPPKQQQRLLNREKGVEKGKPGEPQSREKHIGWIARIALYSKTVWYDEKSF